MNEFEAFRYAVKKELKERGWTYKTLAKAVHYSPKYIARSMRRKEHLSKPFADSVAKALDIKKLYS